MLRRFAIAGAALVVGLVGYSIKQIAFPAPEAAVQRFFEALADRNLSGAAEQMAGDTGLASSADWESMWSALSNPRYQPPAGVRMGGWQHATAAGGERVVAVQFDLAGATYSSLLKLRRQDGSWRITNGMGTVEVNLPNALINGRRAGKSMTLLPGVYEVASYPQAPLLSAPPVAAIVTPDRVDTVRLVPTLTSSALAKVKQYLDVIIKACETTMGVEKHECPFKSVDTTGMQQVRWTQVNLPELTVEQSGPDSVRVLGVAPGSVRLNAIDAAGKGVDRVDAFSINGKCVQNDGSVSCTFSA